MVPSDARPVAAGSALLDSLAETLSSVRRTDVCLRNYDHDRAYDVTLRARGVDGRPDDGRGPELLGRYHLDPGATVAERAVLDPGRYEVVVEADGCDGDAAVCRVGDGPAETVRVETGNGIVAVSEGL